MRVEYFFEQVKPIIKRDLKLALHRGDLLKLRTRLQTYLQMSSCCKQKRLKRIGTQRDLISIACICFLSSNAMSCL